MSEAAREYIRQAITDFWGERCDIPDDDCPTCMVWAEFDKNEIAAHIQRNASQDPEGTWSDGGKEWTPDEVSFKAGWDKAKHLLKPEDLEGIVITDEMVDTAMDQYRWRIREYEADFNRLDRSDEGFWERKYGTNLHSTGLGERRAMRAALKAALGEK